MAEKIVVEPGRTADLDTFDGDLVAGGNSVIKSKSGGPIVVTGTAKFKGDCNIHSNFQAKNVRGEDGRIHVLGDLTVDESIDVREGEVLVDGQAKAKEIDVERRLTVKGDLHSERVDVGGSLEVGRDSNVTRVNVGGTMSMNGNLKGSQLDVGGSADVRGTVELEKLSVGGSAKVGSGTINYISVGGFLESTGKLRFREIDVGGAVRLASGEGEGIINVGGKVDVDGDIEFKEIDVGGMATIRGNAKGKKVEVGGKLRVDKSAKIDDSLEVGGSVDVHDDLSGGDIEVGGSLRSNICIARKVRVGGRVETEKGTKADVFEIGKRGNVRGPIVATRVRIADGAQVEDIYADEVEIRRNSSARNVFARAARIEGGCEISGEVLYTDRLDSDRDVQFGSEPKKVEKLPGPPV